MRAPADVAGRRALGRRAGARLAGPVALLSFVGVFAGVFVGAARAESERLALGTHDAALASALSVAVSPRGLSVVELPEPLVGVADVEAARRETSVPGTVAVVWLCNDERGARALCFYGRDERLVARPITVTSPLAPPDAAALAISVKMLLDASAHATAPSPPPPPPAPPPTPAVVPAPVPAPATLPAITVALTAGARLVSSAAPHGGLRLGVEGVFAPDALERALGLGVALAAGPALASDVAGRTVSDLALGVFARGRLAGAPGWLEVGLGPSLHFLSAASGPSGPSRTDLSLDALVGGVAPIGPVLVGARVGGFRFLTSAPAGAVAPVALPRWNGEALLTVGAAL